MGTYLLTIGHSNHPFDRFLGLLEGHQVQVIADIRRFPGSRKHPHFGRDPLASALPVQGIEYRWFESLGGRRGKPAAESINLGLRNESFRNYADYMLTKPFRDGVEQLLEVAERNRTALMCAEGLFWQCHRRLVSDFLVVNGHVVEHIMPNGTLRSHPLTAGAKPDGNNVIYPGERLLFS